ncbi:MAG TPA: NYN domain-containing protein [Candidatus Nanoarchaeia archaeon]|nr:NYN domain-containing protein [Candidatus Nanoarchaeia archaeon]
MVVNREQRVGVFVDVQNLYYSARHLYNSKVDFKEVLDVAVRGRRLVRALAYTIIADMKDEDTFFKALSTIGFELRAKDLQVFHTGGKKGDWDVGIAINAIEIAPRVDVVILVSGDGDFVPLVEHLKRVFGCKVEAMSFGRSSSSLLKNAVDEFIDLDKSPRFLINPQKFGYKPNRPLVHESYKKGILQKILQPKKPEIKLNSIQQAMLEEQKLEEIQPRISVEEKDIVLPKEEKKQIIKKVLKKISKKTLKKIVKKTKKI